MKRAAPACKKAAPSPTYSLGFGSLSALMHVVATTQSTSSKMAAPTSGHKYSSSSEELGCRPNIGTHGHRVSPRNVARGEDGHTSHCWFPLSGPSHPEMPSSSRLP